MVASSQRIAGARNALRLVSTKGMDRETWLRLRKHGIGSSDAAAAVGLNPYQSMLELWLIKTGRDAELPKVDPNDETSPMYWGTLLEPIVAEHYTKHSGHRVRRINAVLQHPDPDKNWMLANIDREIMGASDVQLLECKTAGEFGSRLWKDGVPEYVQCQVQHQLAVTGKQAADVCVLICGQEIRVYRIERDEDLIGNLIELERQFWRYVETDTPPPTDGSDSAARALQCLYPRDNSTTLDCSEDEALSGDFNELLDLRDQISSLSDRESKLKQRIQSAMGEASRAVFSQGSISWKRSKDSTGLDVTKLLTDQPELQQAYPLIKPGSRRFIVNAA
ncbi:MAG: YqaJ viral recombinase family protein [bacterium]|nr:YqaJ viral recombinase family protein [bacterium]